MQARARPPRLRARAGRLRRATKEWASTLSAPDAQPLPLRHPRGQGAPAGRLGVAHRRGRPALRAAPAAARRRRLRGHRLDAQRRGRAPHALAGARDPLRLSRAAARRAHRLAAQRLAALPADTRIAQERSDGGSNFWTAVGGQYKASLDYVVTLACEPGTLIDARPGGAHGDAAHAALRSRADDARGGAPLRRHGARRERRARRRRLGRAARERALRGHGRARVLPHRARPARVAEARRCAARTAPSRRRRSRFRAAVSTSCWAPGRPPRSAPAGLRRREGQIMPWRTACATAWERVRTLILMTTSWSTFLIVRSL